MVIFLSLNWTPKVVVTCHPYNNIGKTRSNFKVGLANSSLGFNYFSKIKIW